MSLKTSIEPPQPRAAMAALERLVLRRAGRRWPGRRRRGARPAPRRGGPAGIRTAPASTSAAQPGDGRLGSDPVRHERPAAGGAHAAGRPSTTSATSVLLLPASMARTPAGVPCARSCQAHGEVVAVVGEEPVGQPVGEVDLPDERMGEQGLEHPLVAAAQGGLEGQVLVRRDVGDQAGVQRLRAAATGSGADAGAVDLGGHLDDRVVGQERQGARRCGG